MMCSTRPAHEFCIQTKFKFCRLALMLFIIGVGFCRNNVSQAQQLNPQWSKPIDITQPSNSNAHAFGVLLCDQYQNVHLIWADHSAGGAAVYYRNDVNTYWSTPTDVLVVPYPVINGLAAAIANNNDTLHLIWRDLYIRGDLYYSQVPLANTNNPRAWLPPQVIANDVTDGKLNVDAVGIIHVIYGASDREGFQQTMYHISSSDGGVTWSNPVSVVSMRSPVPAELSGNMAVDGAGRIHVGLTLRSQDYGAYSEVGYVRSLDGGRTWSEYRQIEAMGTTFQGVAHIAPYAFGRDEIHLTWHDPRRLHQWSFDGGETWSRPIEIMSLGAAFGGYNQLVKDSAGTLHVVTAEGNGVFSAEWDGTQWGPPEVIDNRPIDPHVQFMNVCQGNQLHVVYHDRLGQNTVWYASRQVAAPHLERRPLPTPTPLPTVVATPAALSASAVTRTIPASEMVHPDLSNSDVAKMAPDLTPVLMPVVPILVLIIAALVFRYRIIKKGIP